MAGTTPNLSYLFYLGFILIPGYVTLRGYLAGNVKLDDLPRTDKILIMVLSGLTVLVIPVVIHRLNLPELASWTWDSITAGYVVPWNVTFRSKVPLAPPTDLSVLYAVFILLSQSFIGWPLGWVIGRKLTDEDGNKQSYRVLNQPWEEVSTHAARGDKVTVVTTQNREITGEVEQLGSPSESYDILLAEPKEVLRDEDGNVKKGRELGAHSYHHYRDISHIEFEDEFDKERPLPWKHAPWETTKVRVAKRATETWNNKRELADQIWNKYVQRRSKSLRETVTDADAVVRYEDELVIVEMEDGDQVLVRSGELEDEEDGSEDENPD